MSLQTSGWVGHQFDDGVFGGKRVPSDPCFIIIFWAMPELVPRIFSCARKGDLQVKHDLQGLDQAQESGEISYSKNVALFCPVENMRNKTL